MTDTTAPVRRTPWHLWVVGVLGLLWNAYGCFMYVSTVTGGDAYLRQTAAGMGWTTAQADEYVRYYHAMPAWMTADWAIGVWVGLLGAVLLLLRRKLATLAFLISLVALVISQIYTYQLANAPAFLRADMIFQLVLDAIAGFLLAYSWAAGRKGILR